MDRVEREHERVVLTRNGRPAAVIMSPADLDSLEDTLELLFDPEAMEEIKAARDVVHLVNEEPPTMNTTIADAVITRPLTVSTHGS